MKKIIALALTASVFAASPALAQDMASNFSGPRLTGHVGVAGDDFGGFDGDFTYGANIGYDADIGSMVVGAAIELQDSSESAIGRDLAATVRLGGKVSPNALVYALGGYTNLSVDTSAVTGNDIHLDGFRLGAGLEVAVSPNVFFMVEERYSSYDRVFGIKTDGWQTVAGIGFRF